MSKKNNQMRHAARNVHLQAVSLGLGTVVVGAFDDDEVGRLLQMEDDERALCIMPVGRV
ncbi:MAG: nitroreductase family protein [Methanosarcinales archaeon]